MLSWRTRHHGYTLIELIIVILIIGLITSVILLRMGTVRFERKVSIFADQVQSFIQVCQQQAILQPAVIGLVFQPDSFQAYYFTDTESPTWRSLAEKDSFWQPRLIPKDVFLHITASVPVTRDVITPQVVIQSNGDLTPFVIDLGYVGEPAHYRLTGSDAGDLTLQVLP